MHPPEGQMALARTAQQCERGHEASQVGLLSQANRKKEGQVILLCALTILRNPYALPDCRSLFRSRTGLVRHGADWQWLSGCSSCCASAFSGKSFAWDIPLYSLPVQAFRIQLIPIHRALWVPNATEYFAPATYRFASIRQRPQELQLRDHIHRFNWICAMPRNPATRGVTRNYLLVKCRNSRQCRFLVFRWHC